MKDIRLRMTMEKEIRELIEASEVEGPKDWLAEKLMDYFEDNAKKFLGDIFEVYQ